MKWRTAKGKDTDEFNRIKDLIGVKRKKFAFLPVVVVGDSVVWLTFYNAIYLDVRRVGLYDHMRVVERFYEIEEKQWTMRCVLSVTCKRGITWH